jgi:hypothetical protein
MSLILGGFKTLGEALAVGKAALKGLGYHRGTEVTEELGISVFSNPLKLMTITTSLKIIGVPVISIFLYL